MDATATYYAHPTGFPSSMEEKHLLIHSTKGKKQLRLEREKSSRIFLSLGLKYNILVLEGSLSLPVDSANEACEMCYSYIQIRLPKRQAFRFAKIELAIYYPDKHQSICP